MKKVFNWLGLIIIAIFSCVILSCPILSFIINDYDASLILWPIFSVSIPVYFALVPAIWDRSLGVLLPIKNEKAQLIDKDIEHRYRYHDGLRRHTATKYFLTFQFANGERKVFCVNPNSATSHYEDYFSVLMFETGTLAYKEQGKHLYFVNFTPDSTGRPIK